VRTIFDVSNTSDEDERGGEADEQLARRLSIGSVDELLRADHAERRTGPLLERARDESAVLRSPEGDGVGLAGREIEAASNAAGPGHDPASLYQQDVVGTLES
jgi:hypothetical protein